MSQLRTFCSLSLSTQLLFFETLLLLPLCQCAVRWVPFKYIIKLFRLTSCPAFVPAPLVCDKRVTLVRWLLFKAVCLYGEDRTRCLAQALAGRILLKQFGLDSVLTIGAALNEENMAAHAWLQYGDIVVSGLAGMDRYRGVAFFK